MKIRNPELADRLAALYVAGGLSRRASARMSRLVKEDGYLALRVLHWERVMAGLLTRLPEVEPPPGLRERVLSRIGADARPPARRSPWRDLWRWWAIAATGATAVLAVLHVGSLQRESTGRATVATLERELTTARTEAGTLRERLAVVTQYALLANAEGRVVAFVKLDRSGGELVLRDAALPEIPAGRALELWAIIADEQVPRSLGLVPAGTTPERAIRNAMLRDRTVRALAISVEPATGSPGPGPTGPVIIQGEVKRL